MQRVTMLVVLNLGRLGLPLDEKDNDGIAESYSQSTSTGTDSPVSWSQNSTSSDPARMMSRSPPPFSAMAMASSGNPAH